MNINFKKLLPKVLQSTRWGEYIEAFQSVMATIKTDKVDIIKNQYILDEMSDAEIRNECINLGYNVFYADGFCSTTEYLKRQLLSIIPRARRRNDYEGYDYIAKIYNLDYDIYPMYYESGRLSVIQDWRTNPESELEAFILDAEPLYYLDTDDFPTLDAGNYLNNITRHLLFSYEYNNIEDTNDFMSENMQRALFFDIKKQKRRTEIVYLEPCVCINASSGELYTETFYNYDRTVSDTIVSYHSSGELSSGAFIKLGDGTWNLSESNKDSITDVNSFLYRLDIGSVGIDVSSGEVSSGDIASGDIGWSTNVLNQSADALEVRKWIYQKQRLYNVSSGDLSVSNIDYFTEIALFDASSGIMMYAEFPQVRLGYVNKKLYNNVRVKINLI